MIAPARIKQIVLILSAATIFLVASLYGVAPLWFAAHVLGIDEPHHNLSHILRAMMCLYFGFGLFWLYAAFHVNYRNPALLTVMLFPAGLVIGRITSFARDGKPSPLLLFYLVSELIQAPLAFWAFRLKE
jgi:ABC-type polysaccharide/polyol phosphate export permease